MLRRKPTSSKLLFLGKSRTKAGHRSFEVCRHNGSTCTCNVTEISVQICEEKISDEVETAFPTERQKHPSSMNPEAHRLHHNQLTLKLNALKQVFSTSVSCFTCTLKPGEGGNYDEGEYHAGTILNRHTRESVDMNTTEIYQASKAEYKPSVGVRETFKLHHPTVVSKFQSEAKSLNFLRLKAFWRKKPLKPFTFLQECNGETNECMAEEIIVLANEHADEITTQSTHTETVKHHCPEMLTVSVDVTAMTLEMNDNNKDSKASKTPSLVSNSRKVMAGSSSEGVIGIGETHLIPQCPRESHMSHSSTVSPDHGCSQNMDSLQKQQSPPNAISMETASQHPADPSLDVSDGSFHVMMVHSEQNAEQQFEIGELFLLDVARSVVEVAIKTALEQFKDEALGTSAHLDPFN
ncbi:hypothetical protein ABVT39_007877 [Epinephelus coioides]